EPFQQMSVVQPHHRAAAEQLPDRSHHSSRWARHTPASTPDAPTPIRQPILTYCRGAVACSRIFRKATRGRPDLPGLSPGARDPGRPADTGGRFRGRPIPHALFGFRTHAVVAVALKQVPASTGRGRRTVESLPVGGIVVVHLALICG